MRRGLKWFLTGTFLGLIACGTTAPANYTIEDVRAALEEADVAFAIDSNHVEQQEAGLTPVEEDDARLPDGG